MSSPPSFRFGVEMLGPFEGMNWADSVRRLETLGYSTMFASDHLYEGYGPITAMATAAMVAPNLQVATAVMGTDFRNPAFLARELASIDRLSEGRLEVGLGAGYQVVDYSGSGIPMDEPKVRVSRLIEHVAVLRGLFAEGEFDFDGEHYKIEGLKGTPAPYTPGGPPIFVAGGGKRMLRFAARHADIIGVNTKLPNSEERSKSYQDAAADRIDEKFAWISDAAGDRYDDLTFHSWLKWVAVSDDRTAAAEQIGGTIGSDAESVLQIPFALLGSPEQIAETVRERYERWGYSYYTVQQPEAFELAPVLELLAR
jgi:probable F420-dependent oxidoreductase